MNSDENKSDHPTPEELLKLLDVQMAMHRTRKQNAPAQRAIILVAGLLLIIGGLLVSLMILWQKLEETPRPVRPKATPAPVSTPR